jgi:hypothetical protein
MIKNIVISKNPLIIKHILSNSTTESESQNGVNEAIELIERNVPQDGKFRLLIDVTEYSFETLEARRIWAIQFKMNKRVQEKTDLVAIVGSPNETLYTEKTWFETTRLKFFEKEEEAESWLLETQR